MIASRGGTVSADDVQQLASISLCGFTPLQSLVKVEARLLWRFSSSFSRVRPALRVAVHACARAAASGQSAGRLLSQPVRLPAALIPARPSLCSIQVPHEKMMVRQRQYG